MNTILQRRIEEAAEEIGLSVYNATSENEEWITDACIEAAKESAFEIINNLWISVEEALPPLTQESGQVYLTVDKNGYTDVKARNLDGWSSPKSWCSTEQITHWMPIPQLKRDEK